MTFGLVFSSSITFRIALHVPFPLRNPCWNSWNFPSKTAYIKSLIPLDITLDGISGAPMGLNFPFAFSMYDRFNSSHSDWVLHLFITDVSMFRTSVFVNFQYQNGVVLWNSTI